MWPPPQKNQQAATGIRLTEPALFDIMEKYGDWSAGDVSNRDVCAALLPTFINFLNRPAADFKEVQTRYTFLKEECGEPFADAQLKPTLEKEQNAWEKRMQA